MARRSLRIARSKLIEAAGVAEVLRELLSAGIIQEFRATKTAAVDAARITFSHHILFDYAISRLAMPRIERWLELVRMVADDRELVVAFRPSLVMHFRYTWDADKPDRSLFWELVFALNRAEKIPLVGKIIGATVAVELARQLSDFGPLFALLHSKGPERKEACDIVRYLVGLSLPAVRLSLAWPARAPRRGLNSPSPFPNPCPASNTSCDSSFRC